MIELNIRGNRIECVEVFPEAKHPNDKFTTLGSCQIEANQFGMLSKPAKDLICELIRDCMEQQRYNIDVKYKADAEKAVKEIKLLLQAVQQ